MILDEKENKKEIDSLTEAYELDAQIKKLQAKLKPLKSHIKLFMEVEKVTILYHDTISARIQHRKGSLKWDTENIMMVTGDQYDAFAKKCSKTSAPSKALTIELVSEKDKEAS